MYSPLVTSILNEPQFAESESVGAEQFSNEDFIDMEENFYPYHNKENEIQNPIAIGYEFDLANVSEQETEEENFRESAIDHSSTSFEHPLDEEFKPINTSSRYSNVYLSIKGVVQGQIKGSVAQKGKEGAIAVYQFRHEIVASRDAASGQATGRRQYKPIVITKEIDISSTKLLSAFTTNENLNQVVINFWRPSTTGMETNYYRITLTNAKISSITQDLYNTLDSAGTKYPLMEKVEIVFQSIEWKWLDKMQLSAADNWGA